MLSGMTERGMSEIMRQGYRMGQILVGSNVLGNAAGNLRGFQRMREPGSVMIPFIVGKNLGFVFQSAKGL
jgi:hypothetical protein